MAAETKIKVVDLKGKDFHAAVRETFEPFGGGRALLKISRDVYIKVNAIDFKPNVYTDPELARAAIRYFYAEGARKVYVIENCTQGNFTRLVFDVIGMARVCREEGAGAVYLDETGASPVALPNFDYKIDLSRLVYEKLIECAAENLYINIPMLKTHSMSKITLGIKNQLGLVHQGSRIRDHNFLLHRKLADIYHVVRPDFTLIDATRATNHGHYNAIKFAAECVIPVGLLVGGMDTLAVDTAGAYLMGYSVDEVEHLRLVMEDGLGCADMDAMDIDGRELLESRRLRLTHELLGRFPEGVRILRGAERCCAEGCRRNTESALEVFSNDVGCRHGFAVLMGKGIDPAAVSEIDGPVLIAGDCAIEEYGEALTRKLGRRRVLMSPGCNNLAATCSALMALMGINALKVARVNPLRAFALLAVAKLRGSKARVTRIVPPRVARR